MCGINKGQFRLAVGQVDDTIALAQQWLEQLHHLADHGAMSGPGRDLAQATVLLGEARAKLEVILEEPAAAEGADGVTIEAV